MCDERSGLDFDAQFVTLAARMPPATTVAAVASPSSFHDGRSVASPSPVSTEEPGSMLNRSQQSLGLRLKRLAMQTPHATIEALDVCIQTGSFTEAAGVFVDTLVILVT